ncbi:MAG TPA: lantibiotic dehydratase, partial [Longimicrobium sp.]|nr:lantibiotic dehydratase [Longimicrobium sp.]
MSETTATPEPRAVQAGPTGYSVYPMGIARVAGQPFDALAALHFPRSLRVHERLARHERARDAALARLGERLHHAVGAADGEARRALLAAARNLRRNHKLSDEQAHTLRAAAPGDVAAALERWERTSERVRATAEACERVYRRETREARRALAELASDEAFLNGIVLGSSPVYERLRARLEGASSVRHPRGPAARRLELTLLRYFARAATKTTPFSTLTSTAIARFSDDERSALAELAPGDAPLSAVTVNKGIYGLLAPLLAEAPELFPQFGVTPNPSLRAVGESHSMLLSRGGREHVVVLPASPVIDRCVALIARLGGTAPYAVVVRELAAALRADPAEVARRVDRLMEAGILQLNSGIPERDQAWVAPLVAALRDSPHPLATRACELLGTMEELAGRYPAAGPAGRLALLGAAREALGGLFPPGGAPGEAGKAPPPQRARDRLLTGVRATPLFEDTAFARPVLLNTPRLRPALDALAVWVDCMSRGSPVWAHRANLRAYYDQAFAGHERVPFPAFYEGYRAAVFDPMLRHEQNPSPESRQATDPFSLPQIAESAAEGERLFSLLAARWATDPGAEDMHLCRDDFAPRAGGVRHPAPGSSGVFAQLAAFAGGDAIVVDKNSIFPGMGKYFSRFLPQFPARYAEEVLAHNARHPEYMVAELCDDGEFSFNGNLHPPLARFDINYPARVTGLRAETNLPLAELVVEPDAALSWRLKLVHAPSGREVLPADLGFLTPRWRPPLFRVLSLFTACFHETLPIPWHTGQPHRPEAREDGVVYRPRVRFEEHVILSRRGWRVPSATLEGVVRGLAPGAAFRALNGWRLAHGIPRHVFFSTAQAMQPDAAARPPGARPPRAIHKPQYVDFESGALVDL